MISSPYLRHLDELAIVAGVHAHHGLFKQVDLCELADFIRVEHPFDVRIRCIRISVVRQNPLANLFDTLFNRQVSLRFW